LHIPPLQSCAIYDHILPFAVITARSALTHSQLTLKDRCSLWDFSAGDLLPPNTTVVGFVQSVPPHPMLSPEQELQLASSSAAQQQSSRGWLEVRERLVLERQCHEFHVAYSLLMRVQVCSEFISMHDAHFHAH
jgi:hypothetical protein